MIRFPQGLRFLISVCLCLGLIGIARADDQQGACALSPLGKMASVIDRASTNESPNIVAVQQCADGEFDLPAIYGLTAITVGDDQLCSYTRIGPQEESDNLSVDYFSEAERGECPRYGDPRFAFVGRVSTKERSERRYRLVRDTLKDASTDRRAMGDFLSDVSILDRFFDTSVREFRSLFVQRRLLFNIDWSIDSMIVIDEVSFDKGALWNVVMRIDDSSWGIDVVVTDNSVSATKIRHVVF